MLSSRSIVLQTNNLLTNNHTENVVDGYADDWVDREGDYYLVRYTRVIPDIYLFSLDSNPWLNPEVQPNDIKEGSFVTNFAKSDNTYQIIPSTGSESTFSANSSMGYEITQDIEIGNKLSLNSNSEFQLRIKINQETENLKFLFKSWTFS